MNKNARKEILEQIEEGKISAENGFNLLQKMERADKDISRLVETNPNAVISHGDKCADGIYISPHIQKELFNLREEILHQKLKI